MDNDLDRDEVDELKTVGYRRSLDRRLCMSVLVLLEVRSNTLILARRATFSWHIGFAATVMPHGLFLGSHLATIDRLDIAPRPPPERESLSYSAFMRRARSRPLLPGKDFLGILKHRKNAGAEDDQSPSRSGGAASRRGSQVEVGLDNETEERLEAEEEEMEKERERYEAEIKAFDRVNYVRISIGHATV